MNATPKKHRLAIAARDVRERTRLSATVTFACKLVRTYPTLALALLPSAALASGSDILLFFWSQLALLAVVVLSLFITRLTLKSKAVVLGVYLLAAVAVTWATWKMPYSKNQAFSPRQQKESCDPSLTR